jgi:lysophospholipase L1-like esterase
VIRGLDESAYEICLSGYVDFEKQTLGLYAKHSPSDMNPQICVEKAFDWDVEEGDNFSLWFIKEDGYNVKLVLMDEDACQATYVESDTTLCGSGWGQRHYTIQGEIEVKQFYDISLQSYDAKVAIIGDSFVEGSSTGILKNARYAYLIKHELKGDVFINGQGGASSSSGLCWLNTYLLNACHPEYMILAFGMNDSDYEVWRANMEEMIGILESNQIIPILVTVTPTGNTAYWNDVHMEMNTYIRNSGYLYIDAAEALSKGHDGTTFWDDVFMDDQVHPTIEGHELIFEQTQKDVPEIFE